MSILSDRSIGEALIRGWIKIDPFDKAQLNPASYDLTLGDEVAVYTRWVSSLPDGRETTAFPSEHDHILDVREPPQVQRWIIDSIWG